jgi:hypothetical protein
MMLIGIYIDLSSMHYSINVIHHVSVQDRCMVKPVEMQICAVMQMSSSSNVYDRHRYGKTGFQGKVCLSRYGLVVFSEYVTFILVSYYLNRFSIQQQSKSGLFYNIRTILSILGTGSFNR